MTVSYTHLDVYKRQVWAYGAPKGSKSFSGTCAYKGHQQEGATDGQKLQDLPNGQGKQ